MDEELNITYLSFGGHVEVAKYGRLYFVVMFTVYVIIIWSNCTIIYVIRIHRNLHEPMYIFIAALSLNSLLFSTAIYPKLLIDFLSQKQIISYSACLFQYFVHYSTGGSDFLLLAAMSYDRYISICKPLQYPKIIGKTTVSILLGVAWTLPAGEIAAAVALISNKKLCKFTLKGIICNNSFDRLICVPSEALSIYGIMILINLVLLPVLFIFFTYAKIFIIAYHNFGKMWNKSAETCLPHLLVLVVFSSLCAFDNFVLNVESDLPKIVRLMMTFQVLWYNPLFNPVIYGLKMKEISKHIRRLFHFDQVH